VYRIKKLKNGQGCKSIIIIIIIIIIIKINKPTNSSFISSHFLSTNSVHISVCGHLSSMYKQGITLSMPSSGMWRRVDLV
jgi:hypothetical protein